MFRAQVMRDIVNRCLRKKRQRFRSHLQEFAIAEFYYADPGATDLSVLGLIFTEWK
jgi:hypothetical protein